MDTPEIAGSPHCSAHTPAPPPTPPPSGDSVRGSLPAILLGYLESILVKVCQTNNFNLDDVLHSRLRYTALAVTGLVCLIAFMAVTKRPDVRRAIRFICHTDRCGVPPSLSCLSPFGIFSFGGNEKPRSIFDVSGGLFGKGETIPYRDERVGVRENGSLRHLLYLVHAGREVWRFVIARKDDAVRGFQARIHRRAVARIFDHDSPSQIISGLQGFEVNSWQSLIAAFVPSDFAGASDTGINDGQPRTLSYSHSFIGAFSHANEQASKNRENGSKSHRPEASLVMVKEVNEISLSFFKHLLRLIVFICAVLCVSYGFVSIGLSFREGLRYFVAGIVALLCAALLVKWLYFLISD